MTEAYIPYVSVHSIPWKPIYGHATRFSQIVELAVSEDWRIIFYLILRAVD